MVAVIDVVVVFPWLPATAMPYFRRISSASSSPRGMTGICMRRASCTSGFCSSTAELTTRARAPSMFEAAWPSKTRAPISARRSVIGDSFTSEPEIRYPRFSSTSAMPLMPIPPMPVKWRCWGRKNISLSYCFGLRVNCQLKMLQSDADLLQNFRCPPGRARLAQTARLRPHRFERGGHFAHGGKQLGAIKLGVANQPGRALPLHGFRVPGLVVVRRERKRHQYGRLAGRGQLADGARSGPADHQVRRGKSRRHVADERDHLSGHSRPREFTLHRLKILSAGLKSDPHRYRGSAKERPALLRRPVERTRTLAAAGDQNAERFAARLRRQAEELVANRESGQLRSPAR